jgi:hypothetical protein
MPVCSEWVISSRKTALKACSCSARWCRSIDGQEACCAPRLILQGTSMGYLISFLLGIFVATVGVSGAASVLDKAVKTTQIYMKESVK